jgi:FMN phosphatase YigB (HAD superfamily)
MFEYSFVDWDNTVYDTVAFEADIFAIFAQHGVSEIDTRTAFKKSLCTVSPYTYDYSFIEHIQFVREMGYAVPEQVEQELNMLFFKDYLFSDTKNFLDFLKTISKRVILLSAGDKNFQMNKISNSSISSYFDEIKIVNGEKEKQVVRYGVAQDVFFVNDNLRENLAVKTAAPSVMMVTKLNIVRNTADEAAQIGVPYFKTLIEIKQYVKQQLS